MQNDVHLPFHFSSEIETKLKQRMVIGEYKKGTYLYQMGDQPKGIFFVLSGLVGLFNTSENGHEHLLRIFGCGQCLGHRSLVAEEPYYAGAKTLEPSKIGLLSAVDTKELIETSPQFTIHLSKKIAKELRRAELRLAGSSEKQVAERVAEALIYLKESFPDHTWTRNEIAFYCGSTGPTVIRTLSNLEKKGLIRQSGREIEIIDKPSLMSFANLQNL